MRASTLLQMVRKGDEDETEGKTEFDKYGKIIKRREPSAINSPLDIKDFQLETRNLLLRLSAKRINFPTASQSFSVFYLRRLQRLKKKQ
jgi:hypothetical protein